MHRLVDAATLRNDARRLRQAAGNLEKAAEILDGKPEDDEPAVSVRAIDLVRGGKKRRRRKGGRLPKRLPQLRKYLASHGPQLRREIIAGTKIPVGSVGMLLKPENGFEKQADGKWGVKQ